MVFVYIVIITTIIFHSISQTPVVAIHTRMYLYVYID